MTLRLLPAFAAAALLAYACGPRPPARENQSRLAPKSSDSLSAALKVDVGTGVRLNFQVTNATPRTVELNFPSGHTHDFVVLDSLGREIWKWSDGRLFTQPMQNRVLERQESLSYQAAWRPGTHHGTFLAVVSLMSEDHPIQQRVQFTVP